MEGNKKIWYGIGLDNSSLITDSERAKMILGGITKKASEEGQKMDSIYSNLSSKIGLVFGTAALTSYVTKIATVRGEFQQLEVAFATMLGSKQKADKLMAETIEFAATTPFDLQQVASGTKQLLAYGFQAEDMSTNLSMLGNVAAGVGSQISDIIYLYGTLKASGRVTSIDINQFAGRGIPIYQALADTMGIAKEQVREYVSAGKVGFAEVEKAFQGMTTEGGMFFDLMQEQSKTITGKISNLGDGISQMFNKIGEANQDIISESLDSVIELVENYEEVGKTIAELIVVYGVYKAVLITTAALSRLQVEISAQQMLANIGNTGSVIQLTTAQGISAVAASKFSAIQKSLNATILANPYVLAATAVAALGYAIYKYTTYLTDAEKATIRVNETFQKAEVSITKEEIKLNQLVGTLKGAKEGTEAYKDAKNKIILQFGDYLTTLEKEQLALGNIDEAYKSIMKNMRLKYVQEAALNATSEANNKLAEKQVDSLGKIREQFTKKYGKEKGTELFFTIRAKLQNGEELSDGFKKIVKDFDKAQVMTGSGSVIGSGGLGGSVETINAVTNQIRKLKEAQTEYDDVAILAENKFNDMTGKSLKDVVTGTPETKKEAEALTSQSTVLADIAKTKKVIAELQKKSKTGITSAENVELTEQQKKLSELETTLSSFTGVKKGAKKVEKKEKPTYDAAAIQRENDRKLEDAVYESASKKLEIEEDSTKKSLELLELEGARKLVLVKRQKDDAISSMKKDQKTDKKENKKYSESSWVEKISEYEKAWDESISQQEMINAKATENFIKNQLEQYLTYEEQVFKLNEDANKKINELKFLGEKNGNAEMYAEKISVIQKELSKALFDVEKLSNKSIIGKLFEDTTGKTIKEMKSLIEEAETLYNGVPKTDENVEKLKAIRDQITKLREEVRKTDSAFMKMKQGFSELSFDKSGKDTVESISKIKEGFAEVSEAVGFFSDSLMSIGDSLGSEGLKDVANTINDVMDVANSTMKGAEIGAKIGGPIGAAAGAALGLATSLVKVFSAKKDKKQEKEIQKMQVQIEVLKSTYDELGKSIEKAYSSDASKLIQQQSENLKKQKTLIEQQIKAEEGKKKSDKGKIDSFKEAIKSIDAVIAESENKQIEAINGKGVKSAIDDFANAYINAWSAGEDKAKSMKDVVRSMVKSAISELVKSRMSGEVEAFAKYLASAMEDGILTLAETNVLDSLENSIVNKMAGLSDTLDKYVVDKKDDSDANREASAKGFGSMSQDSADELNGRFATLQLHTFSIVESMKILQLASSMQLKHLAGIETNTASLIRLEKIEGDISIMKSGISDINDKGIIIRR